MKIIHGCCVGSTDKLDRYVRPHLADTLLTMCDQRSIAEAYNSIITIVQMSDVDALVLQHDDLEITDHEFVRKIEDAVTQRDVALVGVAGGRGATSLAWWNHETVGHQMTDSGMLTFAEPTGDVEVLEGSIIIMSRWAIENLEFDERYGGFHGYDDIGYEAGARDKRVVVIDLDTHHHTRLGWKTDANLATWAAANEKFKEKWQR